MKNSYEVLSPFFLRFTGLCVSVYLCILCVKLFILNPRYAYWQANAFLVWPIILSAFLLCVSFVMFIFSKMNYSRICLLNLYVLCCLKCVLFLLLINTRAYTLPNANMMLKIVLCFGFLFIFLEFLHAQTSNSFVREKSLLSGILGVVSCIVIFATLIFLISIRELSMLIYALPYLLYALYALRIFVFSLLGKEAKSSVLFQCSLLAFFFLISLFRIPSVGLSNKYTLDYIIFLEIFTIIAFTQHIALKNKQIPDDITTNSMRKLASHVLPMFCFLKNKVSYNNDLQSEEFPMIRGLFMLTLRFMYFAFLATNVATIWRGY